MPFIFIQAENSALSLANESQREAYERCLDEVSSDNLTPYTVDMELLFIFNYTLFLGLDIFKVALKKKKKNVIETDFFP